MKAALLIVAGSLAFAACSQAGPTGLAPVELDAHFSLRAGESVPLRGLALRIGFEKVTADSRCRRGEQCVWAGDATVRVWLQQGSGPRQERELHAAAGVAQAASALGLQVCLVRLDPYPVTGRAIAPQDYVATLALSRAESTPASSGDCRASASSLPQATGPEAAVSLRAGVGYVLPLL